MNKEPITSYAAWTEVRLVKAPEAERRSEVKLGTAMLFVTACMALLAIWAAVRARKESDASAVAAAVVLIAATLGAVFFGAFTIYYLIP